MDLLDATEAVAEATRRALDELGEFPDGARLRAAMVLLDVTVPDPDAPDDRREDLTHTIWKSAPADLSTNHAYGMAATAAHGMLHNGGPADE